MRSFNYRVCFLHKDWHDQLPTLRMYCLSKLSEENNLNRPINYRTYHPGGHNWNYKTVMLSFSLLTPTHFKIVYQKSSNGPWALFQYKDSLSRYDISIIKIRPSWDCLIFIMGIPILVRWHLFLEKSLPLFFKRVNDLIRIPGKTSRNSHPKACHNIRPSFACINASHRYCTNITF